MTIDEIQEELQKEIDLCNKYFIDENFDKNCTEHERLALKIVTMCMQTLSALKDGELEELKELRKSTNEHIEKSYDRGKEIGYNKAIDDFKKLCMEIIGKEKYCSRYDIDEIAEQLKVGGTDV